jgi:pimeloyl-ACP methyl ester carboxylesterase
MMVGNSYGGANVQLYAYRYPAEVKGLVLVEPQHEDETERLNKASQGKLKQFYDQQDEMEEACAAQGEQGFKPGRDELKSCIGGVPDGFGPELAKAYLGVVLSAKNTGVQPRRRTSISPRAATSCAQPAAASATCRCWC